MDSLTKYIKKTIRTQTVQSSGKAGHLVHIQVQ